MKISYKGLILSSLIGWCSAALLFRYWVEIKHFIRQLF